MRFWKWTLAATVFLAVLTGCASASHITTSTAGGAVGGHHTAGKTSARAATGSVEPVAATSRTTVHHHFTPYSASGKLRVPVAERESGSCWESSLAAPSTTAFRCLSGNTILDPCFVSKAGARTVACIADPWSKATVLTLTKKLPKASVVPNTRPWAVALTNGARCVAATGTAAFVHGENLDYICANGYAVGLLDPNASKVVAAYAKPSATSFTRVAVRALWPA